MKARIAGLLPEEGPALSRLWLNATDAARVCGVTVRQLTYWTDRGIVPSSVEDTRSYSVAALDRARAIDRLMMGGLTLEKAARQLDELAAQEEAAATAPAMGEYVDGLVRMLESSRRKLPAYLAVANLKRAAASVAAVEFEAIVNDGPDVGVVATQVAARLNAVAAAIDAAVEELTAGQPAPLPATEMAAAGSGAS